MSNQALKQRQWTWMVFLAGDNDLQDYALKDLHELKLHGSSDEVAVVAQYDRRADHLTRRFYLRQGTQPSQDVVAELPESNTGDPATLLDFITWAASSYPARHYALILWGHGTGWKDDDIYQAAQRQGLDGRLADSSLISTVRGNARRAVFRSSLDNLVRIAIERAIAFDDSASDFLDNLELQRVLETACDRLGQPIDILGFDACLMSMLEVHYQLRRACQVVIGSQEIEPSGGWPYDAILAELQQQPDMTTEELARKIVDEYVDHYKSLDARLAVTQAAVQPEKTQALIHRIQNFSKILASSATQPALLPQLFNALRLSQSFTERDYIDLVSFCKKLSKKETHSTEAGLLAAAAQEVLEQITGLNSPLLASRSNGSQVSDAHGISIYLPTKNISGIYSDLDFAKDTQWGDFLSAFIKPPQMN
jgi:hypothetical protein